MNALLSRDANDHANVFTEGHTIHSCTTGVDLCLPLAALEGNEHGPKVAFLDIEGVWPVTVSEFVCVL